MQIDISCIQNYFRSSSSSRGRPLAVIPTSGEEQQGRILDFDLKIDISQKPSLFLWPRNTIEVWTAGIVGLEGGSGGSKRGVKFTFYPMFSKHLPRQHQSKHIVWSLHPCIRQTLAWKMHLQTPMGRFLLGHFEQIYSKSGTEQSGRILLRSPWINVQLGSRSSGIV